VARALNLSHSTVSLALRNSPKIPEERRKQIRKTAQKMGYRPNPAASALAHFKRSSAIAPVRAALAWLNLWPDPKNLRRHVEFDRYWQGASSSARKLGYDLDEIIPEPGSSPERIERILFHRGIGGILIPPHPKPIDWGRFRWENFSAVRFGRSVTTPEVNVVTADHVANTVLAFNEIRARGYERVGFVTGLGRERGHLFEAGFLFAQRFVAPSLRLPIHTITEPQASQAGLERWLKKEKPDAVLTDEPAVPGMLKCAGVKIPDDIGLAVTSLLDIDADAGIDQHPEEIGRVGVLAVVSLINDNALGIPAILRQTLIEGTWVDGSTLPPRLRRNA
jgi:DNA-binding LacI/PurR family transcriptional regulator